MKVETQSAFAYSGNELEIFAKARNWKRYWRSFLRPYIGRNILDVGAGIGATISNLQSSPQESWTAVEPDRNLAQTIQDRIDKHEFLVPPRLIIGTIKDVDPNSRFDTILYVDVLEHIERDRDELIHAAGLLEHGGRIVILAPAHQFLYSQFDRSIGHYRRYNRDTLLKLTPNAMHVEKLSYLDSLGLLASLANRVVLRQSLPSEAQIEFWDRCMVPISILTDRVTINLIGKTIVFVLRKNFG